MASRDDHELEWAELARIDYFLTELARAVESDEVPLESYNSLAPRYLARRAELAAAIEGRASGFRPVVQAAPAGQRPVAPARPPREHRPVAWTTVLTFAGAFLVVVAAAIFAFATWDIFTVTGRLGFLGAMTVGFFVVGDLVRTRMKLRAGGVALTVVASAMLLFDGWIAIRGYNLEGPWPWVAVLLFSSVVYWIAELRVTGGIFGIIGAASQMVWWWMLGDGLGWLPLPRFGAMAIVGALWCVAASRVPEDSPASSLARALKIAGPVAVAGSVLVGVQGVTGQGLAGLYDIEWPEVAATMAMLVAGMVVTRFEKRVPTGIWAVAALPVVIAAGEMATRDVGPSWWGTVILLVVALAAAGLEVVAGGWGWGVAAALGELAFWNSIGGRTSVPPVAMGALYSAVAATWLAGSCLAARQPELPRFDAGFRSLTRVAELLGWILLGGVTLLLPAYAEQAPPLLGLATSGWYALTAVMIMTAWLAVGRMKRERLAAIAGAAMSFYALAALMGHFLPELHSAWYALGLLALAYKWNFNRKINESLLLMPSQVAVIATRVLGLLIPIAGFLAAEAFFSAADWSVVALLVGAAVFWATDAWLSRGITLLWVAPPVFAMTAVGIAGWIVFDGPTGSMLGAVAGLVLTAASAFFTTKGRGGADTSIGAWAVGSALGAQLLAVSGVVGGHDRFAIGLAVAALAWAAAAYAARIAMPVAFAGASLCLATGSMLSWAGAPAWSGVGTFAVLAFALATPGALSRASWTPGDLRSRVRAAFTTTSVLSALSPLAASALGVGGIGAVQSLWAAPEQVHLSVMFAILGGVLLLAAWSWKLEIAHYAGWGAIAAAALVALDSQRSQTVEITTTILAAYAIGMGYLYGWLGKDRRIPVGTDIAGMVIGVGIPAVLSAFQGTQHDLVIHAIWAMALALLAIAGGVGLRVRVYFFGGVAALVWTSFWRSSGYLAQYWWVVLGLLGIGMLVIALTWERQRHLAADAREKIRDTFLGWR